MKRSVLAVGASNRQIPGGIGPRFRKCSTHLLLLALVLAGGAISPMQVSGVLFKSTGDPTYNATEPGGALADSGWQFQGAWGDFLGTPIAPQFFIAAKHVGGSIGQPFLYNGSAYTTTDYFDDPGSDLRIWQVSEPFRSYAPLWTNTAEHGASAVIFGRGTQRGTEVRVNGELKGWSWGASDQVQRWGENQVIAFGTYLKFIFDQSAGENECHLSTGDSSGAVFLQDNGEWKLAGVLYSVDGPYSYTSAGGQGFNACVLDAGGLYRSQNGSWNYILEDTADIPGAFYATRISSRLLWILSIIVKPDPVILGDPTATGGSTITEPATPSSGTASAGTTSTTATGEQSHGTNRGRHSRVRPPRR